MDNPKHYVIDLHNSIVESVWWCKCVYVQLTNIYCVYVQLITVFPMQYYILLKHESSKPCHMNAWLICVRRRNSNALANTSHALLRIND